MQDTKCESRRSRREDYISPQDFDQACVDIVMNARVRLQHVALADQPSEAMKHMQNHEAQIPLLDNGKQAYS